MPQNVGYDQPFNQLNSFADLLFTKKFTQNNYWIRLSYDMKDNTRDLHLSSYHAQPHRIIA